MDHYLAAFGAICLFLVPYMFIRHKYILWKQNKRKRLEWRVYWQDQQATLHDEGICPCCRRTFHNIELGGKFFILNLPPTVYVRICTMLQDPAPQKAMAINLLMETTGIDLERAKQAIMQWDEIF
jgi:hypothetical protein